VPDLIRDPASLIFFVVPDLIRDPASLIFFVVPDLIRDPASVTIHGKAFHWSISSFPCD